MDADTLKRDVEELVVSGGREPGSNGHAAARAFLLERVKALGLEGYPGDSYESPYKGPGFTFVNVMGKLPGKQSDLPPLLVAAHYDTFGPYPGADDNAAAIAILLSVIEPLRKRSLERPVVFAFFDAEEPPYYMTPLMGSKRFYEAQRQEPIHCAIVLDLCGHDIGVPGLEDLLFVTGLESDPALPQALKTCDPKTGIRTIATLNRYVGDMSDHHVFRINRRPYLFLSCGRWPHYHRPTDTPDRLNYEKMGHIADYVQALVCDVAGRDLDGPFEGGDTLDTEIHFLTKVLGPFLEAQALTPHTRQDIERIVDFFIMQFGL